MIRPLHSNGRLPFQQNLLPYFSYRFLIPASYSSLIHCFCPFSSMNQHAFTSESLPRLNSLPWITSPLNPHMFLFFSDLTPNFHYSSLHWPLEPLFRVKSPQKMSPHHHKMLYLTIAFEQGHLLARKEGSILYSIRGCQDGIVHSAIHLPTVWLSKCPGKEVK